LVTDIPISIHAPDHMAEPARRYAALGFSSFKIKVGKDREEDLRAIAAIVSAAPGASLRLDANGGFTAEEALDLLAELTPRFRIECFEQPCADLAGMARVAAAGGVPVLADE